MKNKYSLPFKLIAFLFVVITAASCSMKTVRFSAVRPADIDVPSSIDTILLVNRTHFNTTALDIIEGIITGELPGEDKAGTQETMNTLQNALRLSNRFVVKNASEVLDGNSMTSAFPNVLSWSEVENLCKKYNTQAIVAIEIFDTDFIITKGERTVEKEVTENGQKRKVNQLEYYAEGVANINIGFRVYDPTAKSIVDQQSMRLTKKWERTGNSIQDALAQLIAKSEATKYISRMAGNSYARKISPMPVTISRQFYKKSRKTPKLASGSRQADVNEWQSAIETWKSALRTTRTDKEAGKVSYNIAVAYEVINDLTNAKLWANKAYVEYGNKKAKNYANAIQRRIYDEDRLQKQME